MTPGGPPEVLERHGAAEQEPLRRRPLPFQARRNRPEQVRPFTSKMHFRERFCST